MSTGEQGEIERRGEGRGGTYAEHASHAEALDLAEAPEGLFGDVLDELVPEPAPVDAARPPERVARAVERERAEQRVETILSGTTLVLRRIRILTLG